ncbi:hypothetical protein ACJ6WD_39865 [Streptomyces sp. VTCC 41912]|uniref:hypothetical protein n=1 Tax=Streptomyces sp. VTCC 41912 TaxID=3383243 RepID=UPI003896AEF3
MSAKENSEQSKELPDIYETRQGHAMREAMAAGDRSQYERIKGHVLRESATSAEEARVLADMMHAAELFKEMTEAQTGGEKDAIARRMRDECSHRACINAMAAGYMQSGLREGLPGKALDQLLKWVDELELGPEIRELVGKIERLSE